MTQGEFHTLYEQCAEDFHAQLIDGTVFVREPIGTYHARSQGSLTVLLGVYEAATPGVDSCGGATVILGPKDEVEPVALLRILPAYGGQSGNISSRAKGKQFEYIKGAPEFVGEVAHSTKAIDLNLKLERYKQSGVIEYVVLCLDPMEVHWFDLRNETKLTSDNDSVFRSVIFPGLWIHSGAVLKNDKQTLISTLNEGLASQKHAKFVKQLQAAKSAG
ncbi:MAG TPA: Uma2 family endonuclease [Candidatus Obscuribacterales bacterium]